MKARSGARLAVLALFAAAMLVASCGKEKKDGGPGPAVSLDVQLRTAGDVSVAQLCTNFEAILLTIDEAARSSTFLLGPAGELYGCDGGLCEGDDAVIQTAFASPQKVSVEMIDVVPNEFVPGNAFNVICRGVADLTLGTDLQSLGDAGTEFQANVKLLRIGAMNPLFDQDTTGNHPKGYYLAGAPLLPVPPSGDVARSATGGGIVFAGGFDLLTKSARNEIHVFDPATVSLRLQTETLTTARGGLTATAIANSTRSGVLFAGGAPVGTSLTLALATAEFYDPVAHTLTPVPLNFARSGHSAVYLPDYTPDLGTILRRPAVILLGGCTVGECVGTNQPSTSTVEAVYLARPAVDATSNCTGAPVSLGSCSYSTNNPPTCNANCTNPPRTMAAAGPLQSPNTELFYGHGFSGPGQTTAGVADGAVMDQHTFSPFSLAAGAYYTFAPGVAILGDTRLGIFGGFTSEVAGTPLNAQTKSVLATETGDESAISMRSARGSPTATALFDGRVVIAGGNTAKYYDANAFTKTVELFDPTGTPVFTFLTRLDGMCEAPGAPGCETMAEPRAGHAAVRIDGSASWLNGAVVIAGGKRRAADTVVPELFVPAYVCTTTGAIPGPLAERIDFCDRGRLAVVPTDPRTP